MLPPHEQVVILGLSDDPNRYSHMAMELLRRHGYDNVIGVNPKLTEVDGVKVVAKLSDLKARPHTLTVYLNEEKTAAMLADILQLNPQRIIFNPGAESKSVAAAAQAQGIEVEDACTLVLLRTGAF